MPKFHARTRALHASLGSKRDFPTWFKQRVEECDLVKDVDYSIVSPNLANQTGRGGDRRSKEYWLTNTTARMMAGPRSVRHGPCSARFCLRKKSKQTLVLLDPV